MLIFKADIQTVLTLNIDMIQCTLCHSTLNLSSISFLVAELVIYFLLISIFLKQGALTSVDAQLLLPPSKLFTLCDDICSDPIEIGMTKIVVCSANLSS